MVIVARDPGGGQFVAGGRTPPIEVTVSAPPTHDISSALWARFVLSDRPAGSRLRPSRGLSPAAIAHACDWFPHGIQACQLLIGRRRFVMTAPQNHADPAPPINGHHGTDTASWPTPDRPAAARSRVGGLWVAAVVFAIVLLLLLIFVLQNGQRAEVSFFGAHGHLPMGVALLLAAVFGILLVALPGTARIVQLRILQRRFAGHAGARPVPGLLSSTAAGATGVPTPPRAHRQDG
jgi:uncharacterized integral membrane protein